MRCTKTFLTLSMTHVRCIGLAAATRNTHSEIDGPKEQCESGGQGQNRLCALVTPSSHSCQLPLIDVNRHTWKSSVAIRLQFEREVCCDDVLLVDKLAKLSLNSFSSIEQSCHAPHKQIYVRQAPRLASPITAVTNV